MSHDPLFADIQGRQTIRTICPSQRIFQLHALSIHYLLLQHCPPPSPNLELRGVLRPRLWTVGKSACPKLLARTAVAKDVKDEDEHDEAGCYADKGQGRKMVRKREADDDNADGKAQAETEGFGDARVRDAFVDVGCADDSHAEEGDRQTTTVEPDGVSLASMQGWQ